jgi:hypothetical protein
MSKTPFAQIQLPLSETNGTAPVEFYSKCPLFGRALHVYFGTQSGVRSPMDTDGATAGKNEKGDPALGQTEPPLDDAGNTGMKTAPPIP